MGGMMWTWSTGLGRCGGHFNCTRQFYAIARNDWCWLSAFWDQLCSGVQRHGTYASIKCSA
eukprot:3802784-Amphidinium_carterae.1